MDSLSLHIKRAILRPLLISRGIYISHSLFVDNILLSTILCKTSLICLHEILGKFQKAIGMCVNEGKSSFHVENVNGDLISFLSQLFNIKTFPIRHGLKYLGFNLKFVGYSMGDWSSIF